MIREAIENSEMKGSKPAYTLARKIADLYYEKKGEDYRFYNTDAFTFNRTLSNNNGATVKIKGKN